MKSLLLSIFLLTGLFADEAIINSSEDLTESLEGSPDTIKTHKNKRAKRTKVVTYEILEIKNYQFIQDKINNKKAK